MPDSTLAKTAKPLPVTRLQWLAFTGIILFAALVRFAWLDRIPPGLWYDEALYSLDGYRVSQGHFSLFFAEHGHPREPLFPWMLGGAFALFGPTVLVARCVSALCGTLAVAMMFPVARRFFSAPWALAAMAAFAAFRWHIHFSRTIFRAGLASPMVLLAIWMFLRWRESRRPLDAGLCGGACAVCLYTYISLRVVPVLIALWIVWMLWEKSLLLRKSAKQIAIIGGVAGLLFLPLAVDYLRHPEHLFGRTDEISMFEKDVSTQNADGSATTLRVAKTPAEAMRGILENAVGVAKVWFVRGDYVARHGIPYKPIFDPLTGLLFALGFVVLCARIFPCGMGRRRRNFPAENLRGGDVSREVLFPAGLMALIPVTWFLAFAAASVFSFGAPNILRMQGASPCVILLMIAGLKWSVDHLPAGVHLRVRYGIAALVVVAFGAMQVDDYFRVFPADLRVRSAFGADFFNAPAKAADDVAAEGKTVYVPEEFLDALQVKFVTIRRKNIVPYSPDKPLPGQNAKEDSAAWLVTQRSLMLAEQAGQDQAAQLSDRHLVRSFPIPVADERGRLVRMQPWAQLWM